MIKTIKAITGLLTAVLVIAASVSAPTSAATVSGRIVFMSVQSGKSEIYTAQRDGSQLRQLTANSTFDKEPAVSPDGRQLAFAAAPAFDSDAGAGIVVLNIATGQERVIVPAEPDADFRNPVWSPSGRFIAYSSITSSNEFCIKLYDFAVGGVQKITCGSTYMGVADWSADGTKILFSQFRRGLYAVDVVSGAQPKFLVNADAGAFSPKGDRMVFSRYDDVTDGFQLYVANVDGSMPRPITSSHSTVYFPSDWAEDGYITYSKFDGSTLQTASVLPNGTGEIVLPAGPGAVNLPGTGLVQ